MWEYNYMVQPDELYHYGVPGMKWGQRKARFYSSNAKKSRESAKEWKEIGDYKSKKLRSKGRIKKANRVAAKYDRRVKSDLRDAKIYEHNLKKEQSKNKFREARGNVYKTRSRGAKVATNIISGPFANRTYNSVIAAGGTKTGARIVTALTGAAGGPLGHLVVSSLYTKEAGRNATIKGY